MQQLETLAELVAIPSATGDEGPIAAYVARRCERYGHEVYRLGDNVAVHIPGIDSQKAFLLEGHLDTVPVVEGWQTDPFSLTPDPEDDDKFYGLGAGDMKSGVGLMLGKGEEFSKLKPRCDLWLLFASREEVDNAGAQEVAAWFADRYLERYQTIGGLILEPTVEHDEPFVGVGHRNGLILEVSAEGKSGHGSQDLEDRSTAIEKLSYFIAAGLPVIRADWKQRFSHGLVGSPTINPTDSHAGIGKHNIVPRIGQVVFDLRTTPALNEALPAEISRLEEEYGVKIVSPWEPANTICPPDSHIYRVVQAALPDVPLRGFRGATDLFAFLERGMPMLMLGPGPLEAAHDPNEYVRLSVIQRCGQQIGRIMARF
jgi:acetylornithine deacetylase